jgi:hypothetical protein
MKMSFVHLSLLLGLLAVFGMGSSIAFAVGASDSSLPEEEISSSPSPAPMVIGSAAGLNAAQLRLYPGGRDEQDLKVQSALASPSRSFDGQASEAVGHAGDEEPAPD